MIMEIIEGMAVMTIIMKIKGHIILMMMMIIIKMVMMALEEGVAEN